MDIQKRIKGYLDTFFATPEYADCFVIDIKCTPKGQVTVFVDADTGITLDRCKYINKMLGRKMDADTVLDGKYALEVSSPGTDRPLTMWRQYPKHQGRTLRVSLDDGSLVEGTLSNINGTTLQLSIRKGKQTEERAIGLEEIKESIVQISFKK